MARFVLPLLLIFVGGVAFPLMGWQAYKGYLVAREWYVVRCIEQDLTGKELVIDIRSQKKTQALKMSRDDLIKALWVSELRKWQMETGFEQVREIVKFDPYMDYQGE